MRNQLAALICLALWLAPHAAHAQPQALIAGGAPPAMSAVDFGPNGGALGPNANGVGQGGGQNADFDSLIDLIISTVAPDTWQENGGGDADIRSFAGGVYVDTAGLLQKVSKQRAENLSQLREAGDGGPSPASGNPRRASPLRFVSLVRLEKEIERRQLAHEPLDPAMLTLAGLKRVQYLFVYPESQDLVIAGPASDWRVDKSGRIVSADTGLPVVRLDDFLTLLRREAGSPGSPFGCSITPRQQALAATQAHLSESGKSPIEPGGRADWLESVRSTLGRQDIEVFGIGASTRAARVLVEADYHMKLVGIGLEAGVPGVESYLDTVSLGPGGAPPSMNVLRWWFALNYRAVAASTNGDAFALSGPGAKVLSENELLTEQGARVHTGAADELTKKFADNFTANFDALCREYPVYCELRNLFDLALVCALVRERGLLEQVDWKPSAFLDAGRLPLPALEPPREVDTVINHRVIGRRHIIAAVSGGVWVEAGAAIAELQRSSPAADKKLATERERGLAPAPAAWWWDAP